VFVVSFRRSLRATVLTTCCAAVLLALTAVSAAAASPVTPGSRYLALGDSVTFGYKEPSVVPRPNYRNPASFRAYPRMLGSRLHVKVANAACPGETSASFINPAAQSLGCENLPGSSTGYRDLYPLHVRYRGSQLRYAIRYLRKHRRTRLVSLMVGANDAFLCQRTTRDACTSQAEQTAVFAKIRRNVRRILKTIRRKARYRGQLAVVHYFSIDYSSAFVNAVVRRLNRAMDLGARRLHVVFAHTYGEFRLAALHSGGKTCNAGLLNQLGGRIGVCGVHPSYAGQALLSQALEKAIKF
jgi:lysophospholipase L1-like esterase